MAEGVAKNGLVGVGAGTALGLIAGAAALVIPGIGPAISIGMWGFVLSGATVGAASGVVTGSLSHRWEIRYRDLVRQGRFLVGVHVNNTAWATRGAEILRTFNPEDVEEFATEG